MGLFDIVRDKAAELLGGAGEKVSELTGVDLPGNADEVAQSAEDVTDTATDTATGAVEDLTGTATDVADNAVSDVTDQLRPE